MKNGARPSEVLSIAAMLLAIERSIARVRRRFPVGSTCHICGATNALVLGRKRAQTTCYRDKVNRRSEQHSLIGGHDEPRVPIDPNAHKVLDEVQRITALVVLPGVRVHVACNIAAFTTVILCGLGSLGGSA